MKAIFEPPLIDIPRAHRDTPDPMHDDRDLWLGLDRAEQYLGFTLEDIALMFRHSRHAAILGFAHLGGAAASDHADVINAMLNCLRGLLREAKE
jgi:hypothetical protein